MQIDLSTAAEVVGGAVTAVGGIFTLIKQVVASSKKKDEHYKQMILNQASDKIQQVKWELEERINKLEVELTNQKEVVSKDIGWLKESYANEFKNLAEKINDMRSQLNQQHQSLVTLLTDLVNKQ